MNIQSIQSLFQHNHNYDYSCVESPIETFFLNHLVNFLSTETQVVIQYPIETIGGNFRADIALIKDNKKIVIECDGKEYHSEEKDDWYDEWRDTLILFQGEINTIYRVKGSDIFNEIYKAISIISHFDPNYFNTTKTSQLKNLNIIDNRITKYVESNNDAIEIEDSIAVKRKNLNKDFDFFWIKYVMYSLIHSGEKIPQLIEIMRSEALEFEELIDKLNLCYPDIKLTKPIELLDWAKINASTKNNF